MVYLDGILANWYFAKKCYFVTTHCGLFKALKVSSTNFNVFKRNQENINLKLFCPEYIDTDIFWLVSTFLALRIRTSEILPCDRNSYLTHIIIPRLSRYSDLIMLSRITAYSGTSGSLF